MNLPNKLTILRLIFVPFYVFFMLTDFFLLSSVVALVIFIAAGLTDTFDGRIARKQNLITNFGKFADPLADKILVSAAFVCAVYLGRMQAWICIVILAREFAVSGLRLVAASNNRVLAASKWGKLKTIFQMITCGFLTLDAQVLIERIGWSSAVYDVYHIVTIILIYISLALTLISMFDYFVKNRDCISTNK